MSAAKNPAEAGDQSAVPMARRPPAGGNAGYFVASLLHPTDLLPGSLTLSHTRCGKPSCHCAEAKGHPAWTWTFMAEGKRRVERLPADWIEEVQRRVAAGHEFLDAVREVATANAELLVLARRQRGKRRR